MSHAQPFLLGAETENNLIFGLVANIDKQLQALLPGSARPFLGVLTTPDGKACGAAAMLRPHNVVITRMPPEGLKELATYLKTHRSDIPGVIGPADTALEFCGIWNGLTGTAHELQLSLGVYELEKVTPPPARPSGKLRLGSVAETELLVRWCDAFEKEATHEPRDSLKVVSSALAENRLFVWDDGNPTTMLAWSGPTPTGVRINMVYTPPELRARGYASAAVAALSQQLLDQGRKRCFLFTDLANPTANRIYQKLGYERRGTYANYRFPSA